MIEGLGFIPRSDSAAGAYVQLKLVEQQPMIGQTFTVDVLSSVPMSYLTYQLLGRGDILATDTILMPDRTSHQLKFLASFAMVPMAEVIVFFVRDGQLVSAKLEVVMSESLQNQVSTISYNCETINDTLYYIRLLWKPQLPKSPQERP